MYGGNHALKRNSQLLPTLFNNVSTLVACIFHEVGILVAGKTQSFSLNNQRSRKILCR